MWITASSFDCCFYIQLWTIKIANAERIKLNASQIFRAIYFVVLSNNDRILELIPLKCHFRENFLGILLNHIK